MTDTLDKALASHPTEAQELLVRLCRQPSVAAQKLGMDEAASLVESLLAETGFRTQRIPVPGAPDYVYGEAPGRSPYTLLLYNHYDVQPAEPFELWKSPPFEPTVRDGCFFARGASDNKGELAARLAALRALRRTDGSFPITIRWIVEGEEEIGSPHFPILAEKYAELLQADACLWEGSGFNHLDQPDLVLGTKGLLYVEYETQGAGIDAHSGSAPIVPSPAWRLVHALASLKDRTGRVLIPGFYDQVRQPTVAQLQAIQSQPDPTEVLQQAYQTERFIDDLSGHALLERAAFAPTANIAGIDSGYTGEGVKTVLPRKARAKMDFRLVPDQTPEAILEALRAHLNSQGFYDVSVTKLGGAGPVVTPLEHEFVQKIVAISEKFADKKAAIMPIIGGTLPLLEPLQRFVGVPGLSAPGNPVYWGCGAHAPNEHIRLSDLDRAVRFNCFMFTELRQ